MDVFRPHLTKMVRDNFWKLCDPEALKLRSELPELMVFRAKPMTLFVRGMWGAGRLELKKQRTSLALQQLLPLSPGTKSN